ncbi:hypothetical protein [Frateuria terrea]|uniref:Uncharacterized protein n=1 Tax=Frateuria terrea TaxID=529704 RepID=A0A1H6VRG2_9GAMM|nr:hypothetical protein [Frateuria terrea]SEJ05674.1 hypothetical protein SAMN04487997_2353 [Frateuria terrea]SFP70904.1 hypothetical protein SAMN02927913_3300 [Frateuria terrea]
MPNNLHVSLDESTDPWSVQVDQQGNANHVGRSPDPQTITWQLTGNAASGSIISFQWIATPPPEGIFGSPAISGNGNQLTLSDTNNSASTAGTWTYQLTVEVDGNDYSTVADLPTGTSTTPTIKNN